MDKERYKIKAQELVIAFGDTKSNVGERILGKHQCKECSLILANEIIKHIQRRVKVLHDSTDISDLKDWEKIKKEIIKL